MGCKGVFITRTCFRDDLNNLKILAGAFLLEKEKCHQRLSKKDTLQLFDIYNFIMWYHKFKVSLSHDTESIIF